MTLTIEDVLLLEDQWQTMPNFLNVPEVEAASFREQVTAFAEEKGQKLKAVKMRMNQISLIGSRDDRGYRREFDGVSSICFATYVPGVIGAAIWRFTATDDGVGHIRKQWDDTYSDYAECEMRWECYCDDLGEYDDECLHCDWGGSVCTHHNSQHR